jgi:hypothetical protein
MADNDLLIKINADAKNAQKAFDDIKGQTEDLESQLNKVATVSAIGFAALTAEIALSVHAFAEAEQASRELNTSLQAQGIAAEQVSIKTAEGVTQVLNIADAYKQYATEIEKVTGIDGDAIIASQAIAQNYLGQTQVTKELTQAIADLAAGQKIGLNEAAALIGRTIGTTTNAFARQGLQIADNADKSERLASVLDFVNGRYRGQAEAANQGLGSIKGLATAFSNLQEAIGERFAPVITKLIGSFTSFFNFISQSPLILDLAAAFIVAGTAVTGLGVAIPLLVSGFTALTAAAAAFGVTSNIALAGIPALLGAIVAGVTFVALNWEKSLAFMSNAAQGFVTFVSGLFEGLGKILTGAFSLDIDKINEGLEQIKNASKKGFEEAFAPLPQEAQKAVVEQDKVLAAGAAKRQKRESDEAARRKAVRDAENELLKLQLQNASQDAIEIKRQEIEVLKQLSEQQTAETLVLLQDRYEQLKAQEDEQRAQDLEREAAFEQLKDDTKAELELRRQDFNAQLRDQEMREIESRLLTEKDAEQKVFAERLKNQVDTQNKYILEKKKYGVAYAEINRVINSEEVQGVKQATGELVELQNSRNTKLKAIGKAAAIAQVVIKTAESAVNIYNGFSTIPIIGPALGIAGAAAAIAFGAERIGQINAAQDGALVTGGIPGKDSVPFMLEPGELVVPKRNFEEVVTGVNTVRSGEGVGGGETVALLQSIDSKLSQPSQYIIQGDVLADSTFIDVLIDKINDRLRYGNARLAINGA